jgi:hypothetical protein
MGAVALETLEGAPRAVSMILDPSGSVISDVACENEAIVYADIDVAACVEPKQFHDVVGYYNRFDVFQLQVDRTNREPVAFVQDETLPAQRLKPPELPVRHWASIPHRSFVSVSDPARDRLVLLVHW